MCDLELYFHIKYSITASEICDYSRLYFFILLDQSLFVYSPCDVNTKKLVFLCFATEGEVITACRPIE